MPQRFLRPGLTESDRWNLCSFEAQSMFVRLLTLVDDFGRYDGRVAVLHAHCFALRPDVRTQRTAALRSELQKRELIDIYSVGGKDYLQILRWQDSTRSEKSKYPDPQDSAAERSIPQEKRRFPSSLVHRPSPLHSSSNGAALPVTLDTEGFRILWTLWTTHRREIKHPLTPASTQEQLSYLETIGEKRAIAAIRFTIRKGWQGIREENGSNQKHNTPSGRGIGTANEKRFGQYSGVGKVN